MDHHETSERVQNGPLGDGDGSGVNPLPSSTVVTGSDQRPDPRQNSTGVTANGSGAKFPVDQSQPAGLSPGAALGGSGLGSVGNGATQSGPEGASGGSNPPISLAEGTSSKSGGTPAVDISSSLVGASSMASPPVSAAALPVVPIAPVGTQPHCAENSNGELWAQHQPAETLDMYWDTLTIGENLHGNGDQIEKAIADTAIGTSNESREKGPIGSFEAISSAPAGSQKVSAAGTFHSTDIGKGQQQIQQPGLNSTPVMESEANIFQNRTLSLGTISAAPSSVVPMAESFGQSVGTGDPQQNTRQPIAVAASQQGSSGHLSSSLMVDVASGGSIAPKPVTHETTVPISISTTPASAPVESGLKMAHEPLQPHAQQQSKAVKRTAPDSSEVSNTTNKESVSHAAADLPTESETHRQNRALLVDTYSPYIHPDDTSLDAARERLRTALDQTRILRAAFTDRVYQKYRVVLRPVPKSVDEMIEQITSDPASSSLHLHEEIKMIKEEKELEKKEAAKLNAAVAAATANSSADGGGGSATAAETAEQLAFFGAGLSLVILPEEEIDENEIDISNLEHRGPTDPETGHRVGKISSAAAAAAEALLDRVRKGGAMRMERNRRRQMQALSGDASGVDSEFDNSTMMLQAHITKKGFTNMTSSITDADMMPSRSVLTIETSGKSSKQGRRHGSPKGSISQSASVVDGGKSSRARTLTTATGVGLLSMSASAEGSKSAAVAALVSCGIGIGASTSKSGNKGAAQNIRWKHPHPDSMAGRRLSLASAATSGQSSKKSTAVSAAALAAALYTANLPAELRSLALPPAPQHYVRTRTKPLIIIPSKGASKSAAEIAVKAVLKQFHLNTVKNDGVLESRCSDERAGQMKSDKTPLTTSSSKTTMEIDDTPNSKKSQNGQENIVSEQINQQQKKREQEPTDAKPSLSAVDDDDIGVETGSKETKPEVYYIQKEPKKQGNRWLKRRVTEIGFLRGIQTARNTCQLPQSVQSIPTNISNENSSHMGVKEGQKIDPILAFSVLKAVGFIQDAPSTFSSYRSTEPHSHIKGSSVAEMVEASQQYKYFDKDVMEKLPSNDELESKPSECVETNPVSGSPHMEASKRSARKRSFTEVILADQLNEERTIKHDCSREIIDVKKQRQSMPATSPAAESSTSSQQDKVRDDLDQRIKESQTCVLYSIRGGGESKLDLKDDSYFAEGRSDRTSNQTKEMNSGAAPELNTIGDAAMFVAPSPVGSPDGNLALSGLHAGSASNASQSGSTSLPTSASMSSQSISMGAPHINSSLENAYSLMPQAPISGSADHSQYPSASQTANELAAAIRLQSQQHSAGLEHFHHHTVTSSVSHQVQHLPQSSLHQATSTAISQTHPHSHHNTSDIADYYGNSIQGYGASHQDWSSLGASSASAAGLIPTHSTLAASMGLSQHRAAAMVSLSMRERAARALLAQERQQVVAAHARAQAAAAAAHHQTAATARGGAGISSLSPQQAAAFISGNSMGGPGSTSAYASAPDASRFSHLGAHSAASAAALLSSQATSALLARQQQQHQQKHHQEQPTHQQQKQQPKQQRQQKQNKQQQQKQHPSPKVTPTTKKSDPAFDQQRVQTQNSPSPSTQQQQKKSVNNPPASPGHSPYFGNPSTGSRPAAGVSRLAPPGTMLSSASSNPKPMQSSASLPKSEDRSPSVPLQHSVPQAQSKCIPKLDSGRAKDCSTLSNVEAKKSSRAGEKTVGNPVNDAKTNPKPLESSTCNRASSKARTSDSTPSHGPPGSLEMNKTKTTLTVPKALPQVLATTQDPLSTATAAAAAATAAASTDGMRFFVPDLPPGLSTEFSDLILKSSFHKAAAQAMLNSTRNVIEPNLAKLLLDYLLAIGSAVPIPKALIANPLKERLNTSCFKGVVQGSGSGGMSAPISREVICASIAIWLWVQHKECFQKAFAKSGRIDVDPECKWLIQSAIEASTCALISELPGGGINSGGSGSGKGLGKLGATGGTRDTKGSTPSGMNEIRVASIVSESLMREICINEEMDEALPYFEDLVHLLDELRLDVLRAKSQERVLLAALISRRTNMSESFSHAYVSSLVRAGEALGHEEICEAVQDEATSSSSALPYDILSDSTGAWEDPCRPSSGYLPGLTGDELRKRAHARALIQKSLKKLQDRNNIKGGTSSAGPYGDSSQSSSGNGASAESSSGTGGGISAGIKSHPSSAKGSGSLRRKTSISAMSDAGRTGGGHVSAATAVLFNPNHYSSPLIWNTDDIVNMPYGRHDLTQRNRSSRAGYKLNRSGSKRRRVSNARQSHVPVMPSPNSSGSSGILRSTREIDWSDVAEMFKPTTHGGGATDRGSSSTTNDRGASSLATNNADIFAPYCRKIDIFSVESEDSDESDDEDISDETVLARHQEVLDKMKEKIDTAMEMRQQQQPQSQRSRSRSTSAR